MLKLSYTKIDVGLLETTPNMRFSVAYYLELHNAIYFYCYIFIAYQVKLLMFYNVQATSLTFVGNL